MDKDSSNNDNKGGIKLPAVFAFLLLIISPVVSAQTVVSSADEAVALAMKNNTGLKAKMLEIDRTEKLLSTAYSFEKTNFFYGRDENNIAANGFPLNVFGVSQSFQFPGIYIHQRQFRQAVNEGTTLQFALEKRAFEKEVRQAYFKTLYQLKRTESLALIDSLYQQFKKAANRRLELGETGKLEKITVDLKQKEIELHYHSALAKLKQYYLQFGRLLQTDEPVEISPVEFHKLSLDVQGGIAADTTLNMVSKLIDHQVVTAQKNLLVERSKWGPDLFASYGMGFGQGENAENFPVYQVGVGIPLLWGETKGRAQAAAVMLKIKENEARDLQYRIDNRLQELYVALEQSERVVNYYETDGLSLADETIEIGEKSFRSGETGYLEYIISLENAQNFKLMYLEELNQYNQLVLEIIYFTTP